jgi:hypothetical protein
LRGTFLRLNLQLNCEKALRKLRMIAYDSPSTRSALP